MVSLPAVAFLTAVALAEEVAKEGAPQLMSNEEIGKKAPILPLARVALITPTFPLLLSTREIR